MHIDMTGKVALVTGGSSGIGKAAAQAFAQAGAAVVIASRGAGPGEETARNICAEGGQCTWVQADVTQAKQVAAMVKAAVKTYGRVDFAFNNGGSGGMGGPIHKVKEEEWDKTINGFLKSVFLCMKYELEAMMDLHIPGVIVNNASVDGERAFPGDAAYSAAKHGVLGLTKSTALRYARYGMRINAICPGWIQTPSVEDMIAHQRGAMDNIQRHQPIGRLGKPEEVAQAVLWLCSDGASLVLGTALAVDGGYLAV